ncbi:MAG: hypothetical protein EBY21_10870 [Alphaproteobacteria bacterium]|nr:hypothetical protein [Alphaproteobacteria bacterium]
MTLPSPPRKLDEAYLEIQKRLEEKDVAFKRERFVYLYIIIVLFDGLILSIADIKAFTFFLLATLILAIALAHWLEFPWIVTDLRVWLNKLHKGRQLGSNKENEIEP